MTGVPADMHGPPQRRRMLWCHWPCVVGPAAAACACLGPQLLRFLDLGVIVTGLQIDGRLSDAEVTGGAHCCKDRGLRLQHKV